MKEIEVGVDLFDQLQRAARGDPRSGFRVGETLCVRTAGKDDELHLHITFVQVAPYAGGKISFGVTVLPFDIRWNRLWSLAQQEVPMFRKWLWDLMSKTNDQVDEQHFLATQYDDEHSPAQPKPRRRP